MTEIEEQVKQDIEIKEPKPWRVIFHNDDKTTQEFVVFLLNKVFDKTIEQATALMLEVHTEGSAIAGIYTHEIAENKMNICINTARQQRQPLEVSIEEEE